MQTQIDFNDLLKTVSTLKAELDAIDSKIVAEQTVINEHRMAIARRYHAIEMLERKRTKVKRAVHALSAAMAASIQQNHCPTVEALYYSNKGFVQAA